MWLATFSEWFYADVFPNLVASAICFVAGFAWAHFRVLRPLHRKMSETHEIAKRLDADRPKADS